MQGIVTSFADVFEYEKQLFEQRANQGLEMDRSQLNFFHAFPGIGFANNDKDRMDAFSNMSMTMLYEMNRQNPTYRREVNARLVNLPKIHNDIINMAKPILLDIFKQSISTDKDWKSLSEIPGENRPSHEKTIRRRKARYKDVFPPFNIKEKLSSKDKRVNLFTTSYSGPAFGTARLDTRNYVDYNYFNRLKKFWNDVLYILEEILNKFGPIKTEMDWFVYHIVNNDIGLHVLFDDLSFQSELSWFKTLEGSELKCTELQFLCNDPHPFTPNDATNGILELKKFIQEFDKKKIPSALHPYMISQKTMKKRMYEIALHAADRYNVSGNRQLYELLMREINRIFLPGSNYNSSKNNLVYWSIVGSVSPYPLEYEFLQNCANLLNRLN